MVGASANRRGHGVEVRWRRPLSLDGAGLSDAHLSGGVTPGSPATPGSASGPSSRPISFLGVRGLRAGAHRTFRSAQLPTSARHSTSGAEGTPRRGNRRQCPEGIVRPVLRMKVRRVGRSDGTGRTMESAPRDRLRPSRNALSPRGGNVGVLSAAVLYDASAGSSRSRADLTHVCAASANRFKGRSAGLSRPERVSGLGRPRSRRSPASTFGSLPPEPVFAGPSLDCPAETGGVKRHGAGGSRSSSRSQRRSAWSGSQSVTATPSRPRSDHLATSSLTSRPTRILGDAGHDRLAVVHQRTDGTDPRRSRRRPDPRPSPPPEGDHQARRAQRSSTNAVPGLRTRDKLNVGTDADPRRSRRPSRALEQLRQSLTTAGFVVASGWRSPGSAGITGSAPGDRPHPSEQIDGFLHRATDLPVPDAHDAHTVLGPAHRTARTRAPAPDDRAQILASPSNAAFRRSG